MACFCIVRLGLSSLIHMLHRNNRGTKCFLGAAGGQLHDVSRPSSTRPYGGCEVAIIP